MYHYIFEIDLGLLYVPYHREGRFFLTDLLNIIQTCPSPFVRCVICHLQSSLTYRYPEVGQWEGDGLEQDIGILSTGQILREYAKTCAKKVGSITFSSKRMTIHRPDD